MSQYERTGAKQTNVVLHRFLRINSYHYGQQMPRSQAPPKIFPLTLPVFPWR